MNKNRLSCQLVLIVCFFLFQIPNLSAQNCGCNFTVSLLSSEWFFDGVIKGVKPGDKICFTSGSRAGIEFRNIHGTAANPVIITNMCDGKVTITQPNGVGNVISTAGSSYFRFTGSSNPNIPNGIELIGGVMGANFQNLSTNFEVDHIYVHDTGSCGIQAKTNPTCAPATQRGNFVMQGCLFHDNLVENTYNEGFYIGNSHHDGGVQLPCGTNGALITIQEHLCQDIQIYNNTIKNAGNESIQVGATTNVVAHHNSIFNGGWINPDPAQSNGFQSGSGSEMTAYNNLIISGGNGFGIIDFGGGGYYFNNIIVNGRSGGIFLNDPSVDYDKNRGYAIINNTIVNGNDYGVAMYSTNPLPSYFYNNIQVGQLNKLTVYQYVQIIDKAHTNWNESNNYRTMNVAAPMFKNAATNDYHLLIGSPAIDAGKNVASYGFNFDFDGNARPKGKAFDIGAFEFQPSGPTSNAGPNQSITLPTSSVILPGSGTSATGITGYQWTEKSGAAATLTNATTSTLTVTGLSQGIYVFELTVTDANGSAFSDVTVTVLAGVNQNPTANAGGNQTITLPTNSITLHGMGTSPSGTITAYAWIQTSGPGGATLTGAATPNLAITGMVAGIYNFQLTVTDNQGLTNSTSATVTVNPATVNQPPVVGVGSSQTVYLPVSQITLIGTASDPDGTIASVAWTEKSGTAVTLTGANTLSVNITGLAAGNYIFRLTATDNLGATTSADVTVNVIQANQPPTANAGLNQSITLPTNSVILPGSGSDADGTITSYLWTEISGPAAILANASTATLSVSNMVQGTYLFGLTVTDNGGATGFSQVTVNVSVTIPVNIAPTALAGGNVAISLPTNLVNLYGAGFDPDGSIASYSWALVSGGTATLSNANTPTLTASNLQVGQYFFGLTVTDNQGATNTDIAVVTVSAAGTNISPVANAGQDQFIQLPLSIATLSGSGADADGSISSYVWSQVSGPVATIISPATPVTIVSNLSLGDFVFRLTVVDNAGASDFNDVAIHVLSATTKLPPTVSAGSDVSFFLPQNSTTLNGSAKSSGTITSYLWVQLGGPAATMTNQTTASLLLQNLVQGTYSFELTATDNNGLVASDVAIVNVYPAAFQPPIVNAGTNQIITLPTNQIAFTGTASSANGSITSTIWTQVSGTAATLNGVNTLTLQVSNLTGGTYVFKLTATDNNGKSAAANVQLVVNPLPPNQPPLVSAGSNQMIQLPTSQVTFTGTATDSDGTIAGVQWTQSAGPSSATLQNAATLSLTALALVEGTYTFRLTATDNLGATASSDALVIVSPATISNPGGGPSVVAGPDTTLVLPDNQVIFNGTATDATGTIQDYLWTQTLGAKVTLASTNTSSLRVSDLIAGGYKFQLKVTDDLAKTDSAEVTLAVIEKDQEIPKFFSPNNDGIGEFWVFRNIDTYNQCKLIVFSRSGQVVYEANPYTNSWAGTYNGRPLGDGDYYYNLKCLDGRVINGAVRIIR